MIKTCTKCGKEKDISCFDFRKDSNKYRNECKECRILIEIKRYKRKKKYIRQQQKEYYIKNKKAICETKHKYRLSHDKIITHNKLKRTWRRTKKYYKWRTSVYKKFNYICQDCGKTNCKVYAHHIKEAKQYPKLRYSINNGICLCKLCHYKRHNYRIY